MRNTASLVAAGWIVAAAWGVAAPAAKVPQTIVMARVSPNAGQMGLFIAAADGSGERPLVPPGTIDYNPAWSPDGRSIVFTSDRAGSAELFRINPDGSGLEQLTTNPAYDDQAAFSPDGQHLVFVSTRANGRANLWTMNVRTRRARPLTSGVAGDFRPAWSPDGTWIAFASDRGTTPEYAKGRWEHLQSTAIYLVHPDGSGLKQVGDRDRFCGSPKFSRDGRRLLAYCMDSALTLEARRFSPGPPNGPERTYESQLVQIDVDSGRQEAIPAPEGLKYNPSAASGSDVGYIRKDGKAAGIYYTSGRRGPEGRVRAAAWSPDGTQVVFNRRLDSDPTAWLRTFSRHKDYELTLTGILPRFNSAGDRFVMTGRPAPDTVFGAALLVGRSGSNAAEVLYQDKTRNVMAPSWSPTGDRIIFGIGTYNLFFNGFNGTVFNQADRVEGGAQLAMINADGSGYRELTSGPANNAFPTMAPDGNRVAYRTFGPDGEGLRIMDLDSGRVTTLLDGYDNFPTWSPRGDLIAFSRVVDGDYEIFTIRPDGTGLHRVTNAPGSDGHMQWSPDGEHLVFASNRMGFKDESPYLDAPQPQGEIFVMRADGSGLVQLTDNQWEEGTPAWQPATAPPARGRGRATAQP